MKIITSLEEYYTIITTEPTYILIYSSTKGCGACDKLKTWMDKEYPTQHGVYIINIYNDLFQEITSDIYAIPTIEFRRYTIVDRTVEGYQPLLIKEMLSDLQKPIENEVSFLEL